MPTRIKRNFRNAHHPTCLAHLRTIAKGITNNPRLPEPFKSTAVPTPATFTAKIEEYQAGFEEAVNGDRIKIAIRNKLQDESCEMAEQIARYVEVELGSLPEAILSTGFEVVGERPRTTKPSLVPPVNFKIINAEVRGAVVGRAARMPGAGSYEIQINAGDPKVETEWTHKGVFIKPVKMKIDGLEAGKEYFFRARAIGEDGPGPWSSPVNTIVT